MADVSTADWSHTDLSVLYDVFAETETRLGGELIALRSAAEEAGDADEAEFWAVEVRRIMRARRAVDPDDREAIIAAIEAFNHELRYLRYARGQRVVA